MKCAIIQFSPVPQESLSSAAWVTQHLTLGDLHGP